MGRKRRRWDHPVSALQAARYERRMVGREVCAQIRRLCPGHGGRPCRLEPSKLSDYERGVRAPGRQHALCFLRLYGKTAGELGLLPADPADPEGSPSGPEEPPPEPAGDPVTLPAAVPHCCRCCPEVPTTDRPHDLSM